MTATSFQRGITRQIIIGRETTFGTLAASGSGKILRRVNASPNLNKDNFASQEILASQQYRDMRHGTRRPGFALSGQLAPGSYTDFFEAMLRRAFAAGATTGALITVAAAAGPPGTFTRSAGSFITDGFKVGDVVRWTGWTTTGLANNARNYRISALTATVMTVAGVGNETVAVKAAGDSVTCTVVGKKTFMPVTGQQFFSYTIEDWNPEASPQVSERYTGNRIQSLRLMLPPTGNLMLDAQMVGKDQQVSTTQYFASATTAGTSNALTAVSGAVRFNGLDVANITGAQVQFDVPVEANPVVGANTVPEIFQGALRVSGQLQSYFTDRDIANLFLNETEVDLVFYLTADGTVNSDFITLVMNRVKLMSHQKNDGQLGLIQSMQFQALEHVTGAGTGTAFEATTITVQDSAA
jgi:hypothetical protein